MLGLHLFLAKGATVPTPSGTMTFRVDPSVVNPDILMEHVSLALHVP